MIRGLGDSVRYVPTILTWRNMCVIFLSGSRQLKRSRPNGSRRTTLNLHSLNINMVYMKSHCYRKTLLMLLSLAIFWPKSMFGQEPLAVKGLVLSNVKQIARVTGTPLPGEAIASPNSTAEQFDVAGTDLGIMWALDQSRIGIFFGDTNGAGFVASEK